MRRFVIHSDHLVLLGLDSLVFEVKCDWTKSTGGLWGKYFVSGRLKDRQDGRITLRGTLGKQIMRVVSGWN
jgi:hypothetical protein